jgi:hypothetical protein
MKEINLNEQPFIIFLDKFFRLKTIKSHLNFLDEWLELVVTDKSFTKKNIPADVLRIYNLYIELYELAFELANDSSGQNKLKTLANQVELHSNYKCCYLFDEEIVNPILAFQFIFDQTDVSTYKTTLNNWLESSLNNCVSDLTGNLIFPFYSHTKKLLEASWLIYQRAEARSKNQSAQLNVFQDTCPLLLEDTSLADPYLKIESFFSNASLGEYRTNLKDWFKAALVEKRCFDKAGSLVYFHGQLIELIQAGYLIVKNNLPYQTEKDYSNQATTFSNWINKIRAEKSKDGLGFASDYSICALTKPEINEPLKYLKKHLKLKKIKHIRYGLQEWLYCGLSKTSSIAEIETKYVYQLYENLEKLIEAFFLLIIGKPLSIDDAPGE